MIVKALYLTTTVEALRIYKQESLTFLRKMIILYLNGLSDKKTAHKGLGSRGNFEPDPALAS
jgi:hypothetical protein